MFKLTLILLLIWTIMVGLTPPQPPKDHGKATFILAWWLAILAFLICLIVKM